MNEYDCRKKVWRAEAPEAAGRSHVRVMVCRDGEAQTLEEPDPIGSLFSGARAFSRICLSFAGMGTTDFRYFALYKPFGVLSQFTEEGGHPSLASIVDVPKDVYPVGRLDRDSEGLLILTNDNRLNQRLLNPAFGHERTYFAQVEGAPDPEALRRLAEGVTIRVNKKDCRTRPARASLLDPPPELPERDPPVRFRKSVPDHWIALALTEGKNRQVRRMTAAVGLPTLRLVRARIGNLRVDGIAPGKAVEMRREAMERALFGGKR